MMTTFIRTPEGQVAAYDTASAVPRKLRSILKLVDGRTTLVMLEQNLQSFGDIKSILKSLMDDGLIKILPDSTHQVRDNTKATETERLLQMLPSGSADWMPTLNPYLKHSQPGLAPAVNWAADSNLLTSNIQTFAADSKRASALKAVVDDMSSFVLTHLPEQSFSLLKEIEEITSMELLAVTLGGYEQMVSHLGQASEAHLKYIKQVIRDNM